MLGDSQTGGRADVLSISGALFTDTCLETSRRYQCRLSFVMSQINIDSCDLCNNRLAHLIQAFRLLIADVTNRRPFRRTCSHSEDQWILWAEYK